MGHKTLIGGTAYDISGGKTLIGGTAYDIKGGRTLIGGTGYDISFAKLLTMEELWNAVSLSAIPSASGSYRPYTMANSSSAYYVVEIYNGQMAVYQIMSDGTTAAISNSWGDTTNAGISVSGATVQNVPLQQLGTGLFIFQFSLADEVIANLWNRCAFTQQVYYKTLSSSAAVLSCDSFDGYSITHGYTGAQNYIGIGAGESSGAITGVYGIWGNGTVNAISNESLLRYYNNKWRTSTNGSSNSSFKSGGIIKINV